MDYAGDTNDTGRYLPQDETLDMSGANRREGAPAARLSGAAGSIFKIPRFFVFLATGGLAALVNLVSRYLLTPVVGYEISIIVAYLIGMVVAFALFRTVVFGRSDLSIAVESYRFVIVNMVALALVWIISVALARFIFPAIQFQWHSEDIAHFIGTCVPAITSYLGHSKYTFGKA